MTHHPPAAPPPATPPPAAPPKSRFGALAWTAVILGIVGVVGSPILLLNNLTAVVAGVGLILGVIALFGTRKILALIGIALCIAAITFTVMAQDSFSASFGNDPAAAADVTVADCAVRTEFGSKSSTAKITVKNSTAESQTYSITVSVNDKTGARVGTINSFVNSLAAGQSTTLTGVEARGLANEDAKTGAAACVVADVTRFPS